MLKGFSHPLSPLGKASLIEPLPHHISSDAIQVNFRANEIIAKKYLPEGIEPIEGGLGFAYIADMLKVSESNLEQTYNNPEKTQYMEGIVGFYGNYKGLKGRYSAFIWVDQDWSAIFGQFMGWPKKVGHITKTKIHEFNPGMKSIGIGTKLKGSVSRHGIRILDIGIEIERKEADNSVPSYGDNVFLQRYIPSIGEDFPEINQLCKLPLKSVNTIDVWSGKPFLSFGESDNEELAEIGDVELLNAYNFKRGWTTGARVELIKNY